MSFLELKPNPLQKHSRWASWEKQVLSHLPCPNQVQALILSRQAATDVELEECQMVEEFIADRLCWLEYQPEYERIHIPSAIAAQWYLDATKERKTINGASRTLTQFCTERKTERLSVNPSRKYGRGFVWTGSAADEDAYVKPDVAYDLKERHDKKKDEKRHGGGADFWK